MTEFTQNDHNISDTVIPYLNCTNQQTPKNPFELLSNEIEGENDINPTEALYFINKSKELFISELTKIKMDEQIVNFKKTTKTMDEVIQFLDRFLKLYEVIVRKELEIKDFTVYIIEYFSTSNSEYSYFLRWGLFVCINTILFNYEKFNTINLLLKTQYRLQNDTVSRSYCRIRPFLNEYNVIIKKETIKLILKKRTVSFLTEKNIIYMDMMLYQLSFIPKQENGVEISNLVPNWHPFTYIFPLDPKLESELKFEWKKFITKGYCMKILPLFEVDSIIDLKSKLHLYPALYLENDLPGQFISEVLNLDQIGSK